MNKYVSNHLAYLLPHHLPRPLPPLLLGLPHPRLRGPPLPLPPPLLPLHHPLQQVRGLRWRSWPSWHQPLRPELIKLSQYINRCTIKVL